MRTNRSEWAANVAMQPARTPPVFPPMRPSDFAMERARKALARRRMRATLNALGIVVAFVVAGLSFV